MNEPIEESQVDAAPIEIVGQQELLDVPDKAR